MSIASIESDYTPKDFLEKLLGRSSKLEPLLLVNPKAGVDCSNSQSTIQDTSPAQVKSPRSTTEKRVHFQSVQNIQSPQKKQSQYLIQVQKGSFQFKENLKTKPLTKQKTTSLYIKDQNPDSSSKSTYELKMDTQNNQKAFIQESPLKNEESLILQKTKLILKSILKNKMQNPDIDQILNSLQSGLQNSEEFGKVVSSSSIQLNQNPSQIKFFKNPQLNTQSKSRSVQNIHRNSLNKARRAKSVLKIKCEQMSKKQKKKSIQQSKQQILKSVKKMKQLIFLNEKSLKRTRRL